MSNPDALLQRLSLYEIQNSDVRSKKIRRLKLCPDEAGKISNPLKKLVQWINEVIAYKEPVEEYNNTVNPTSDVIEVDQAMMKANEQRYVNRLHVFRRFFKNNVII